MATNRRFITKNGLDANTNSITNLGTLGSSLILSGEFSLSLTTTGNTTVRLPLTGIIPAIGSLTPLANGVASNGISDLAAREDHVHPSITSGSTLSLTSSIQLLSTPSNTPPTTPVGYVGVFGKSLANREMIASVDSDGFDAIIQPAMWRQKLSSWNPPGNTTKAPDVFGTNAMNIVGTNTARIVATTNLFTRTRRLGYVSPTTVGSLCGHYSSSAQHTTGTGTGLGGFFYSCRFGFSDATAVAGARAFVGLSSSIVLPTNIQPNTLVNCIGVAQLSTDSTQLYLVYGGSSAQTAIPLGTTYPPMSSGNGIAYDITIYASSTADGIINYRLEKIGTTSYIEGTIVPSVPGVQTPSSTTLLANRSWRCNNTTALAVGIDIINFYIETDY